MTDIKTDPSPRRNAGAEKPSTGKQRLLEAAERLFASKGFLDVSAAEIVREAGVAHGLLFHHFGSMEELYSEVSRTAVARMDVVQLKAFRGRTPRIQVASFLRAHMRFVRQRQGDALARARSHNLAISAKVADIWDASRLRAIRRVCEVLRIDEPSNRALTCLRAWIGFYDQLVMAWLSDRSVTETEVVQWTLRQLDHLAAEVLLVEIDRDLTG